MGFAFFGLPCIDVYAVNHSQAGSAVFKVYL